MADPIHNGVEIGYLQGRVLVYDIYVPSIISQIIVNCGTLKLTNVTIAPQVNKYLG